MADLYGVNATKLRNVPEEKIPTGEQSGKLRVAYDKYSLAAAISTDTINLMLIPKGARIIDVVVKFADLSSGSGTLDVGWAASSDAVESADDDGFFNELAVGSAGCKSIVDTNASIVGHLKKFDAECRLIITNGGTSCDATSGDIEVTVLYTME